MSFLKELLTSPLSDKELFPESYKVDDTFRLKIDASGTQVVLDELDHGESSAF